MATSVARRSRVATPERWQKALERALTEGIEVRQVNSSGMWVANSGTHANVAYVLEIVHGVVRSCSCPAGEFGDACCKHAARYYFDAGLLDPEPPAAQAAAPCGRCHGAGALTMPAATACAVYPTAIACRARDGAGQVPLVA